MAVGSDYPELADFYFLFSPAVIFSFKDCCQHLSRRLCEALFFPWWRPDSAGGNRTKRDRSDCRDGDCTVGGQWLHFTLEAVEDFEYPVQQ